MERTAEANFANRRLVYLNARLDLLRGVLEKIRDNWTKDDIQELRDQVEQRWSTGAVLPVWAPLYEARRTASRPDELQKSITRALTAVENLRAHGDGELPNEVVGDWSSFVKEYKHARFLAKNP